MLGRRLWAAIAGLVVLATTLGPVPPAAQAAALAHPRVVLDAAKLGSLTQRAQANDPAWISLRQKCEGFLLGTVEWPDGNTGATGNDIGSGYKGENYFPAITSLGLCYRIAKTVDPARAALYGAKGVDVLIHMSAPAGEPHSPDVSSNRVYGIRFYGLGMALGFDWLYEAMSAADRSRIITALDRWIDTYEVEGYSRGFPSNNYFTGYYSTKAVAALATEGDSPRAPAQWTDFLNRVHGQVTQPYFAANLDGGGWPDGQNYAPLATFNLVLPVLAAKTAKGIDLVNAAAPFRYPSGAATWYLNNVWPSLKRVDDRGTMRSKPEPAAAPVAAITQLAGMLPTWNDPLAPAFHRFARDVRAANADRLGDTDKLWSDLLFWDPAAPEADYKTSPLASYARGMEMGSARSSWDNGAVLGSFNAGPYTGYQDAAEQLFDAGSLAVTRGNRPFLVNATAEAFRGTGHDPDGFVYNDNFGDTSTRGLYNVFYTDTPTPTGQGNKNRADGARTKMSAFDQTQDYVFMQASRLEDMYPRRRDTTGPIASWTRDVVYLRPNLFVVYDRTTTTNPAVGQWMRFHFAGAPNRVGDPAPGVSRYDVGSGAGYTGSVSTLLPANHQEQVTPTLFSGSALSRLDVRPTAAASENRWLTVVDAATSPAEAAVASRLSAADGNVLAGAVTGTVLRSGDGNFAVLSGTGDTVIAPPIRYRLGAESTRNIITGLAPDTSYAVTTTADQGGLVVEVTPGAGPRTSSAGVLSFTTAPGANCQTSPGGGVFVPTSFPARSGTFAASWDVTPQTGAVDGAVGLAKGAGTTWKGLAGIVRFGPDGTVDARDGSGYPASSVHYAAGVSYRVRVEVDVVNHRYSAWLQAPGAAEVSIAQGYRFRTEQQSVTSLDTWVVASDGDQLKACGFTLG